MKLFIFTWIILTVRLVPCMASENMSEISPVKPPSAVSEMYSKESTISGDLDEVLSDTSVVSIEPQSIPAPGKC